MELITHVFFSVMHYGDLLGIGCLVVCALLAWFLFYFIVIQQLKSFVPIFSFFFFFPVKLWYV